MRISQDQTGPPGCFEDTPSCQVPALAAPVSGAPAARSAFFCPRMEATWLHAPLTGAGVGLCFHPENMLLGREPWGEMNKGCHVAFLEEFSWRRQHQQLSSAQGKQSFPQPAMGHPIPVRLGFTDPGLPRAMSTCDVPAAVSFPSIPLPGSHPAQAAPCRAAEVPCHRGMPGSPCHQPDTDAQAFSKS